MARAFLFFVDQVQSLAHIHVGSSPIVGACPLLVFIAPSMPPITTQALEIGVRNRL
jgi:hypothetical protein